MKLEPQDGSELPSLPTIPALPAVTPPSPSPVSSSPAPIPVPEPNPELDSGRETQATVPIAAVATQPEAAPTPDTSQGRRFALTLALVALVFAILGGGLLFAAHNTAQAEAQPARVAQAYCQDLQSQHFSAAYALLSSAFRANMTPTQFTQLNQLQDGVDGYVRACPTAVNPGLDFSFGPPQNRVAFLITIVRGKPFSGHIELIRQQGGWRVEAMEQSLQGTDVAPLVVANTFCGSIIHGDYAAAYQTLSSRQQSLAPETAFAQQFKSSFGGPVRLYSCTLDYASYHVQAGAAAVSMTFNLTISMPTSGTLTTGLVTVLDFSLESGGWKLDDFTPVPSA